MAARREYGAGSVYQRADGKWVGAIQAGFTATGGRRRVTVVGRTEAEARRKLRDKKAAIDRGESAMSPNTTVKSWADRWLPIKQAEISPQGFRALSGPVRKWIVPTIGHKRLSSITPDDVRAVEAKQRQAGLKGTTCAATQRALFNMLRSAEAEGHIVSSRVYKTKTPRTSDSDRQPLTIPEALAVLLRAADLPHGTRWAAALLMGMRQGECLGLTWDAVDFDQGKVVVEWQLQRLPYLDRSDRAAGFRVPVEYDHRQVYKAWHLVRPKSKAGFREYPLMPQLTQALIDWREVAPANPAGLVWSTPEGRPRLHTDDLAEWHHLQDLARVKHPSGRYYHVHECRNVTATELGRHGVDASTLTSLLGHTSITTSQGYDRVDLARKQAALSPLADVLRLEVFQRTRAPKVSAQQESVALSSGTSHLPVPQGDEPQNGNL